MNAGDFAAFEALVRKLEKLYGKSCDDELVQAYWNALRDVPLAVVIRRVEEHIKRAKFFPKPTELRPKESAPVEYDDKVRREFDSSVAKNVANWEERMRENPLATKWMLLQAYAARLDVQEDRSSVIYAEKMQFAREVCGRLLRESGDAYVGAEMNRWRTVNELLGPQAMERCLHAYRLQLKANVA